MKSKYFGLCTKIVLQVLSNMTADEASANLMLVNKEFFGIKIVSSSH